MTGTSPVMTICLWASEDGEPVPIEKYLGGWGTMKFAGVWPA